MRYLFNLILCLAVACSTTGCFNPKEEVWIEADGSGRIHTVTDLSSLYPFMKMGISADDSDPFSIMMNGILSQSTSDTTILFKDLFDSAKAADELSWEQALENLANVEIESLSDQKQHDELVSKYKALGELGFNLKVDKAIGGFIVSSDHEFDAIDDVQSVGSSFMELMEIGAKLNGEPSPLNPNNAMDRTLSDMFSISTSFASDGNTLQLRRKGLDTSLWEEDIKNNIGMLNVLMGDNDYQMIIHFPGKIKKISSAQAEKMDDRTVLISVPFEELFDPYQMLDIEIQFNGMKQR